MWISWVHFKNHLGQQKEGSLPFEILKRNRKLMLIEFIKFIHGQYSIAEFDIFCAIGSFACRVSM